MGISLEPKRISHQQSNSRPVQERVFVPPTTNRPTKHHFDPLYKSSSNIRCEFPKEAARPLGTLYRRSIKSDEAVVEDGELVKHMTRLPGYLKGIEKAENSQDKVLNVGVLDWSRLEQWKQKNILEKGSSSASTNSGSSFTRKSSRSSSSVHTSYSGGSSLLEQRPSLRPCVIPPSRSIIPEKKGASRSFGTSFRPKESSSSPHGVSKRAAEEVWQEADAKRNNFDRSIILGSEATSSKYSATSVRSHSRVQDSKKSNTDIADPSFPGHGNRIVLLLPKESPEKGLSEVSRHRLSFDKKMMASRKCSFLEDISASEIPRSRRSSASVDTDDHSHARDKTNLPSTSYYELPCSERKGDCPFETERVVKNSGTKEPVEIPSQDHAELMSGSNSRNPSPVRRFSFSLGRMGRSLSFKEDNGVPQLSSTHGTVKSGPVSAADASNSADRQSIEKAKGHKHNRARSSPLRRLLDPILKHKEANQAPTLQPEYRLPPKASFDSRFSSGPVYSFPNEKTQESRVQALLHVKVNNGIPLFKFVVNSSGNILAATMKSMGSSDKDDSGRSYTFYLVNEIKKKSGGWISHGSKVKNCGYAYNVVGQMKVSTSEFSGREPDRYISQESVLFGVERKQVDQGSPKFVTNRELAASVVKIPIKDESGDEWCLSSRSRCSGDCVSVILPGGVHGIPNKGEPSPLLSRWKNGGSCDCGGWDIGCKLQVLSDQSKCINKSSKSFKDGRILDSFELFIQGVEKNVPIFSLIPSKDETFSVEYDTSVSRLQAFFICVALLSGQKETSDVSESKTFKTSPDHGVKFPTKYATNPPLSPAGRV